MSKKCSVDIDGILNYYPACWVDFINRETGLNFKDKAEAKEGLSPEKYRSLKDRYRTSEFKANLPVRESALELLNHLKDKGYLIALVTSRPFGNYSLLAATTKKWLDKNGAQYDTLAKKSAPLPGELTHLDFHIDDEIEDANLIAEAGYKVFLFNKSCDNEVLHPNVTRIKDLKEIVNHVGE